MLTFVAKGLYQLASQYYDKVLSAAGQDESQELSREAAYNLSLIYAVSGSNALAQNLMKNFLVY